jgi:hypothetical protein
VLGQIIDLDANGVGRASVSSATTSRIDSRAAHRPTLDQSGDDVGLEATDNIYLTETDGYLRLVLAHAYEGDIRLTARIGCPQRTLPVDRQRGSRASPKATPAGRATTRIRNERCRTVRSSPRRAQ